MKWISMISINGVDYFELLAKGEKRNHTTLIVRKGGKILEFSYRGGEPSPHNLPERLFVRDEAGTYDEYVPYNLLPAGRKIDEEADCVHLSFENKMFGGLLPLKQTKFISLSALIKD